MIAMSAAAWSALATGATFFVLVATAVFAWGQVSESARLRRAQTRPFIVVQYEFRSVLVQIVVRNIGNTVGRNIRIEFDPPIQSHAFSAKNYAEMSMFSDGIPNLAPGQELRIHFDHLPDRVAAGMPMSYAAAVTYADQDGRALPAESYVLDLGTYLETARPAKGLPELVQSVEALQGELRKWTDGGNGLLVNAIDRESSRHREERPFRIRSVLYERREGGTVKAAKHLVDEFRRRHGLYSD